MNGLVNDCSIHICSKVAEISSEFEEYTGSNKKDYLIHNIELYNSIVQQVSGYCGSFGTGYPFYALSKNLAGNLPVIDEQIDYNNQLIQAVANSSNTAWTCATCLFKNSSNMPDLKQVCKPCPNMDDALKPRKVINRLPDIDMWMVCEDHFINDAKDSLMFLLGKYHFHPSDINPLRTIYDITEITDSIKMGLQPTKLLPLDAHIISSSTLLSLIEQVPFTLKCAKENNQIPYLPIHPLSYRKVWQYDDTAYNFIHDYLSSFTEFNFNSDLQQMLEETRNIISMHYTVEELYQYLLATGPESVKRRHKTLELKGRFEERIESWKK